MNTPSPYKISGLERRALKKEMHSLKRFVKMFWFNEDIDRVYGSGLDDEECNRLIDQANLKVEIMEKKLNELNK